MKTRLWLLVMAVAALGLLMAPAAMAQYDEDPEYDLEIVKEAADEELDQQVFEFFIECDGPQTDPRSTTEFVTVGQGAQTVTFPGNPPILDGDICTITERGVEAAQFIVEPEGALGDVGEATVDVVFEADTMDGADTTTATLTVINEEEQVLGPGDLEVTKDFDLDAVDDPELVQDLQFEFTIECDSIADPVVVNLGDGDVYELSQLLSGDTCVVTEGGPVGDLPEGVEAFRDDITVEVTGAATTDPAAAAEAGGVTGVSSVTVTLPEILEGEPTPLVSVSFTNVLEVEDEEEVLKDPGVDPDDPDPDRPDPPVDDDEVDEALADTGFEVTWAMLLAAGLLIPGSGFLLWARRRENGGGIR